MIEFEPLLSALRFACRSGFANLSKVQGVESLAGKRLARARAAHPADSGYLDRIEAAVRGFDALGDEEKRAAVRTLASLLGERLELPEPLAALVADGSQSHSAPAAPKDVELDALLSTLRGVGPARAKGLEARGLRVVRDLLWFLPTSYQQRRTAQRIADLTDGQVSLVSGTIEKAGPRRFRRTRGFEATLTDGSGVLRVRFYRGYRGLEKQLPPGARVALSGKVRRQRGVLEMAHPEILDPDQVSWEEEDADLEELLPRYGEVEGFHPRAVRDLVGVVLPHASRIEDCLPQSLVEQHRLLAPGAALHALHRPDPEVGLEALNGRTTDAHRRLIYDEFFFLQLGLALKAQGVKVEKGIAFSITPAQVEEATGMLPFDLTGAQRRVIQEIATDLRRDEPMNRLLQGDVGSGKTAVAAVALALVVRAGWQGAVMAPTELLAEQHARVLRPILDAAGIELCLLTGRLPAAGRREALEAISSGRAKVVVGTHALIQEGVEFWRLGLVVIDEQHRFGVQQRADLMGKGERPDVLVMTATPIPRSLAMTAYGDLALSLIDELPPGRTPVTTKVYRGRDREKVYRRVRKEIGAGRQAYVVYPLVEVSERMEDVKAATEMADELRSGAFSGLEVALLHGRMASAEKDEVMGRFEAGEIDVLVATTVIEVGIDVANASVMVVEHAERFGLSQLHQLRGRVGRGAARSFCFLVADDIRGERVRERLGVMEATTDGFRIAEEDLRIRGPGELLGTRQSGLPDLLYANIARDQSLLAQAREDAQGLVARDPTLGDPDHRAAAREVRVRWGGRIRLGRVG